MSLKVDVHQPERTCFGCGKKAPKKSLLRFACDRMGRVVSDPTHTAPGRGLYMCAQADCFSRAIKRGPTRPLKDRGCAGALKWELQLMRDRLTNSGNKGVF